MDGSGGYTVNGICEKVELAREEYLLPLAFAKDVKLKCDASKGEAISWDMVDKPKESRLLEMRMKQDSMLWK